MKQALTNIGKSFLDVLGSAGSVAKEILYPRSTDRPAEHPGKSVHERILEQTETMLLNGGAPSVLYIGSIPLEQVKEWHIRYNHSYTGPVSRWYITPSGDLDIIESSIIDEVTVEEADGFARIMR